MTANEQLIRRADMALSDLENNGGMLLPEQANRFIDMVVEQPTMLSQARFERMNGPEKKIEKMGFTRRILQAATQSGGAQDDGSHDRHLARSRRSKPDTSKLKLVSKEMIGEVRIPYEVLEDNIEGQSMEDRIMRQMAERLALDLEEWALIADEGYIAGDAADQDFFGLGDGWLKRADANVVNHADVAKPAMFVAGMLGMPQKYLRNLGRLKHFVTVGDTIRYRDGVSARQTGYGDAMLTTAQEIFAAGVRVEAAPLMPQGYGLFTFPQNLIFGMQRQISIETDKDIRGREIVIVVTCRVDAQIEDVDAVVKYTGITTSPA